MYKKLITLLLLALLLSLPAGTLASPLVRIGIVNGKDSVTVSGQRAYKIIDAAADDTIAAGREGEKWRVTYRDGHVYLNSQLLNSPVIFRLEPGDDNENLMVDGRRYRGELEIRPSVSKKGITVIEILPLEEYIYGVVPWEVSPAWPMEALKAQAVASRTYALYNLGKYARDGFDLNTTTDCQMYGGRDAEDPRSTWAVDATRGIVITYKNKLVPAYFHSSSGGYTENIENVWPGKQDFLRAVPDYDQASPYFQWKITFTPEEISKRLQSAGYNIGCLQGIKLSPLHNGLNESIDRGISGRVKTITFLGSAESIMLTGNDVRQLFKLRSTLFDVRLSEPGDKALLAPPAEEVKPVLLSLSSPLTININKQEAEKKSAKRKNDPKIVTLTDAGKYPLLQPAAKQDKPAIAPVEPVPAAPVLYSISQTAPATVIVFEGRGSGHGLGLSQWGAKAMAEQGPQNDPTYYQQILKHYYQGIEILKWY